METTRANKIIVDILQKSLAGKLTANANVNPMFIAEAIATKVQFEKSYISYKNDKVISVIIDKIVELQKEMKEMLDQESYTSNPEEKAKLIKNFINGKLNAYEEVLNIISKL